jgi:hypothetical protein
MFKFYNNHKRVYPINNPSDHYTTIHKLHYKPFYLIGNNKKLYKKQQKICERLCYGKNEDILNKIFKDNK